MREILSFAVEHGFELTEIIPDRKIHRFEIKGFNRKAGFYVGYQNHSNRSGEMFYVVVFGNIATGDKYIYQDEKVTMSKEDKKNLKAQIEASRNAEAAEREKYQREVSEDAQVKWESLFESGTSDYLTSKMISIPDEETGFHNGSFLGVRFSNDGLVYIPIRDANGKLWSLQKIKLGFKNYMAGGKKSGCFHTLGDIESSETIRLVEGFATGVSVHKATAEVVIVTFDSGNLPVVAKLLKERFPEKQFIICGDDDRYKTHPQTGDPLNAGREKGDEAAKVSLGTAVYPKFNKPESKGTDFNDLHCEEGITAVKDQLSQVVASKLVLYALGFNEKEYFFTSSSNRQIVGVTTFTETDFLNLMPVDYWEALYPSSKDSGGPDYRAAKSQLMQKCRERGLFNGFNVRGSGVWMDEGRIVVNMGDHLIVDGRKMGLGEIRSKFFYTLGMSFSELHTSPLTAEECAPLVNACLNFKWTKKDSGVLLAGALVLSRACGALPVRPHVWVTGGAETGKTTLLEKLISPIIGPNSLYVSRGTTEAGVRQKLKQNSVPVSFDEFETTNTRGDEQIDALIELMRGAWSDSHAKIIKGGSTGNAVEYAARFSAIVSSIRTKLTNDADKGRFALVELAPHGGDQDHWKKLKEYLAQITDEFADRLFARTIRLLPVILENQKILQAELAQRSGSRFGDQYGMILAGYASLIYDGKLTQEEAEFFADHVELQELKEEKSADHEDCLVHLLTSTVTENGRKTSISNLIEECAQSSGNKESSKRLKMHGLAILGDFLFVANEGHAELSKIFFNSRWKQWPLALRRIDGAQVHKKNVSMLGTDFRGTLIPLKYVLKSK